MYKEFFLDRFTADFLWSQNPSLAVANRLDLHRFILRMKRAIREEFVRIDNIVSRQRQSDGAIVGSREVVLDILNLCDFYSAIREFYTNSIAYLESEFDSYDAKTFNLSLVKEHCLCLEACLHRLKLF